MDKKQPERLTSESYMSYDSHFGIFRHRIADTIAVHWHEFFEMAFVTSGEGTHILNGTSYPLTRGSLFLLSPADFHEIVPSPGTPVELYNFIFSERTLREDLYYDSFQSAADLQYTFEGERLAVIESEFMRIWMESSNRQFATPIVIQGALERIVIELARALRATPLTDLSAQGSSSNESHAQTAVRKTLTYLQHHFRESITLDDAAKQARLSPNYYSECFHKQFGISFQTYLQELRLQFAGSLLKVSDLPVTEICFAAGFNTLPHFERMFKRKFGLSPRQFRKLAE
ncbi:AraC family transcriptional regulator [Paenibacillus mendelii]|uniref:Helix-turn-helix domain-containing protein n=1 Tax=Paenibacillus mendelii TaxID=206163 RepID=A0ABV6JAK9_9BACL|nr:AraC family transcriptional regulator [Paenibacillus mendelii]MCQ6560768.1 AraC family transcriptional regulator [Paenibacillus mendelii]